MTVGDMITILSKLNPNYILEYNLEGKGFYIENIYVEKLKKNKRIKLVAELIEK